MCEMDNSYHVNYYIDFYKKKSVKSTGTVVKVKDLPKLRVNNSVLNLLTTLHVILPEE